MREDDLVFTSNREIGFKELDRDRTNCSWGETARQLDGLSISIFCFLHSRYSALLIVRLVLSSNIMYGWTTSNFKSLFTEVNQADKAWPPKSQDLENHSNMPPGTILSTIDR